MMPDFLSRTSGRQGSPQLARCWKPSATARGLTWACTWTSTSASVPRASSASPGVEKFNLTWLECDIHDPEALALLRRSTRRRSASLETIHGLQAFKPYLANYACDVAIVDVQWNGMWESVRIRSLADAFRDRLRAHNFAGHMSSLISAHFCAAIRTTHHGIRRGEVPWRNDLFTHPPVIENGQLVLLTVRLGFRRWLRKP